MKKIKGNTSLRTTVGVRKQSRQVLEV